MTRSVGVAERYGGPARLTAALLCAAVSLWSLPASAVDVIEKSFSDTGDNTDAGQPQSGAQQSPSAVGGAAPQQKLTLDQRVTRMEHMLDSGTLVDMLTRLNSLEQDLQALRGELEVQRHDLDDLQKHQRDLYLDIDRRLRALEVSGTAGAAGSTPATSAANQSPAATGSGATPVPEGVPSTPAAALPAAQSTAPSQDTPQAQAAYSQAFNLLRSSQYDQAIAAFKQFIADHPTGPLSGNAQYWLGEADYVTRRFPAALKEFQKVVSDYPDSPKVPDAVLKIGFTQYELAQWDHARKTLTDVVNNYPDSSAAKLAQNRLQKMKAEGH